MMEIRLLALAALVAILPAVYIYLASIMQPRLPMLRNKRICLLIAHPDDEAMFFAPSILALTRPETGNTVKILCLSTGNARKIGEIRKQELKKSARLLGLRDEEDVFVIHNEEVFPDSMTAKWDRTKIATLLCEAFAEDLGKQRDDPTLQPTVTTDVIITFDQGGISSHPNHISLYHGARTFIAMLTWGKKGVSSPVDLYTLTSINILRKYSWFLDLPATILGSWSSKRESNERPKNLVFLNSLFGEVGYPAARKAMTDAHLSQMVWFRHAWILFSRYMYINDLRLEKVENE